MNKIFNNIINSFKYEPENKYSFTLAPSNAPNEDNQIKPLEVAKQNIFPSSEVNLEYIKVKFNSIINSDIKIREFDLTARNKLYKAFILYIDGMSDSKSINRFILHPLMLKSRANTSNSPEEVVSSAVANNITVKKVRKFNLVDYIYSCLIPHNDLKKVKNFEEVISAVNAGNCALFIDTIDTCFVCEVKGYEKRSIDTPRNEIVIRGSQEAFVENIRTNTSMLRRLVNNENLIIEDTSVGAVSQTRIAICYLKDVANDDLVAEVKYRINNLDIDHLISSGQLEQLIQDDGNSLFPQVLATERPDKTVIHLLEGRVVIIVNGSPYVLVVPGVLSDFMSSPEDTNNKYQFSNLLKFIRLIAAFIAVFLPGLYVAITSYHHELLPTELLFTIEAARETVPFPTIFEILLMEIAFELIREAGLRVPSPIGPTIGIVGGLILGEAAVSANLVSPVLIIIVALTAICSFSIPDFSFNFTVRITRFIYIILGYIAGFLGIAIGVFIQIILLCNLKSFGCAYLTPYILQNNKRASTSYFLPPIWKRENRSNIVNPKKKYSQGKISMLWRNRNI